LTIYGTNINLAQEDEQQEAMLQAKTWKPGGVYRILSFGKTPNGPPSAGIWMIVRLVSDGAMPYKILSRKTM
jgi:hypothetical protein